MSSRGYLSLNSMHSHPSVFCDFRSIQTPLTFAHFIVLDQFYTVLNSECVPSDSVIQLKNTKVLCFSNTVALLLSVVVYGSSVYGNTLFKVACGVLL